MVETALCDYEVTSIELGCVNDTNFVADTGDTSLMVSTKKYMTDLMHISNEITMGTEEHF
jgi:hypothetical protein